MPHTAMIGKVGVALATIGTALVVPGQAQAAEQQRTAPPAAAAWPQPGWSCGINRGKGINPVGNRDLRSVQVIQRASVKSPQGKVSVQFVKGRSKSKRTWFYWARISVTKKITRANAKASLGVHVSWTDNGGRKWLACGDAPARGQKYMGSAVILVGKKTATTRATNGSRNRWGSVCHWGRAVRGNWKYDKCTKPLRIKA